MRLRPPCETLQFEDRRTEALVQSREALQLIDYDFLSIWFL
jgi:hypothetical protein